MHIYFQVIQGRYYVISGTAIPFIAEALSIIYPRANFSNTLFIYGYMLLKNQPRVKCKQSLAALKFCQITGLLELKRIPVLLLFYVNNIAHIQIYYTQSVHRVFIPHCSG